jgi:hypothetical protein
MFGPRFSDNPVISGHRQVRFSRGFRIPDSSPPRFGPVLFLLTRLFAWKTQCLGHILIFVTGHGDYFFAGKPST